MKRPFSCLAFKLWASIVMDARPMHEQEHACIHSLCTKCEPVNAARSARAAQVAMCTGIYSTPFVPNYVVCARIVWLALAVAGGILRGLLQTSCWHVHGLWCAWVWLLALLRPVKSLLPRCSLPWLLPSVKLLPHHSSMHSSLAAGCFHCPSPVFPAARHPTTATFCAPTTSYPWPSDPLPTPPLATPTSLLALHRCMSTNLLRTRSRSRASSCMPRTSRTCRSRPTAPWSSWARARRRWTAWRRCGGGTGRVFCTELSLLGFEPGSEQLGTM